MGLMKNLFIDEQEKMAEEFMEKNPDATDEEAWEYVNSQSGCDEASSRAADTFGDMADRAYDEARDRRNEH